MTKEGHSADQGWSPAVRRKLQELAELISQEQFGEAGIPKEITFSEIEEIGHQVGQLAAGTVDQTLQLQHADHLPESVCHCPNCERDFFPSASLASLDGRAYSPAVLERIVSAGGLAKSFAVAAKLL